MKRPEGFDRGRTPPGARPAQPRDASRPHGVPRAQREPKPQGAPEPERARKPERRPTRIPARGRSPRAEIAAAERRRRREERAEIRRFTRAARRRRLGWLAALLGVGAMAGLVGTAVFSPVLALRHVVVDGTDRLDADEIVAAVDGQLGTPLALLDENRIRDELARFSLIRSYVTELVPPDTMVIHIVERQPIGVIAGPDGFRLVDPAGVTIDTLTAQPAGAPLIRLAAGDDVDGAAFRSMAEVLRALPAKIHAQVTSISARTRDDVTLELEGSSQRVVWGSAEDSDRKAVVLERLVALHSGDGPGEYDVSAPAIGIFRKD